MLPERDPETEILELRRQRENRTQQDLRLLKESWQAIVRSHRLLDREVYQPKAGELHLVKDRRQEQA